MAGSKFFPSLDPFSEGFRKANKKSQKLSSLYEMAKNLPSVSSPLNPCPAE